MERWNIDAFVKSPITSFLVIPAKAGIQVLRALTECLDPGLHRGDDFYEAVKVEADILKTKAKL